MTQTTPEIQTLQNAIETIDGVSQSAFSKIAAIARLVLHRLESPGGCQENMADIANAIEAIADTALDARNCINAEAEAAGCAFADCGGDG